MAASTEIEHCRSTSPGSQTLSIDAGLRGTPSVTAAFRLFKQADDVVQPLDCADVVPLFRTG
jgi:hypothetical protein